MTAAALLFICLACRCCFPAYTAWCTACGAYGLVVLRGVRPRAAIDSVVETTTARAIAARSFKRLVVPAFEIALGPGALVIVHGPPGAGKSTWALRVIDSMPGPTVLATFEEGLDAASLQARFEKCSAKREDLGVIAACSLDQLAAFIQAHRAVALAVDSYQAADPPLRPRDLRHLLAVSPDLQLVVAVAQNNKTGGIAGRADLAHEGDVVVLCHEKTWSLEKSRFEATPTPPRPVLTLNPGVPMEK